jgi:hypothetical protein
MYNCCRIGCGYLYKIAQAGLRRRVYDKKGMAYTRYRVADLRCLCVLVAGRM